MGCLSDKTLKVDEDNTRKENQDPNVIQNLEEDREKEKEKIKQEQELKDQKEKEELERIRKEQELKDQKEKEELERIRKEQELKELKEKEEKERLEKELKEKEEKERLEKEKKEKEEDKPNSKDTDEQSGNEERSHNSTIPSDPGKYLDIHLSIKKNNIYVPDKNSLERFQRDGLKRHNYYRKYHQAGPMELTQKLNEYAQKYAETLAAKDIMQHSTHDAREKIYGDWTGENLYYYWSSESDSPINGAAAVDSWYDEIKDYDFKKGKSKNGGVVGHFTQLVWRDSTQLGIGVAKSAKNSIYVVANYHPGGNFNSNELNNVFPESTEPYTGQAPPAANTQTNNEATTNEESGKEEKSHNSTIPSDPELYLSIPLNAKKNNIFVPDAKNLERFQKDGLKRHNYYRKYHNAPPMELTQKLNEYAQKYAETLAAKDIMQHSTHDAREKIYGDWTGENLYYFWSSDKNITLNGAAAVDSWYDEIKDYDFKKGKSKNGGVVGHFTQLVWKDSTQLGIGVAKSAKNSIYVVANYHPGGNFNSNELNNVFPAKV